MHGEQLERFVVICENPFPVQPLSIDEFAQRFGWGCLRGFSAKKTKRNRLFSAMINALPSAARCTNVRLHGIVGHMVKHSVVPGTCQIIQECLEATKSVECAHEHGMRHGKTNLPPWSKALSFLPAIARRQCLGDSRSYLNVGTHAAALLLPHLGMCHLSEAVSPEAIPKDRIALHVLGSVGHSIPCAQAYPARCHCSHHAIEDSALP